MDVEDIFDQLSKYESESISNIAKYIIISLEDKYKLLDEIYTRNLLTPGQTPWIFGKKLIFTENLKKDQIIIAQ